MPKSVLTLRQLITIKITNMAKSTSSKRAGAKRTEPLQEQISSDFQPEESKIAGTSGDKETGLEKLFADSIKDIYWAENHLVKSLPKMINAAASSELQGALSDHLKVTEEHVARLDQVFEMLGKKPQAKKCDAMASEIFERTLAEEKEADQLLTTIAENSASKNMLQ